MRQGIRVLLLTQSQDFDPIVDLLQTFAVETIHAGSRKALRKILGTIPPPHVVIAEELLPDGDWRHVRSDIDRSGLPIEMILCTHAGRAPELWVEAVKSGVFDLLVAPCEVHQLSTMVEEAASCRRFGKPASN